MGNNRNNQHTVLPASKIPPHSDGLEKVVLGALMIDKDAFYRVSGMISPETFYDPRHKLIYMAIQNLKGRFKSCDIVMVTEELNKMGKLEEIGGVGYIVEISSLVASSVVVIQHSEELAAYKAKRDFISLAYDIEKKGFDSTVSADDLEADVMSHLVSINARKKNDFSQVDPIIAEALKKLQEMSGREMTGVPSGFRQIDWITSGWQPGDYIIDAARPSMGKTAFVISMACNIAVNSRIPMVIFTLEMTSNQLIHRLMSNICEIDGKKFMTAKFDQEEWDRIDKRVNRVLGAPLYLDDTPALSVFDFKMKAHRMVQEYGVKIIAVDYLQLMKAHGAKFTNRQEEVSIISRELQATAKELNVPVIALSQLNRNVESREGLEGKRPRLSDLRESGTIEQDADIVLFIHRPEYYHIYNDENGRDLRGKAQIIIAKHRKGECGDALIDFNAKYTQFTDNSNP